MFIMIFLTTVIIWTTTTTPTNLVYSQQNKTSFNETDSLIRSSISVKKVQVGDTDIVYKMLRRESILFISSGSSDMND